MTFEEYNNLKIGDSVYVVNDYGFTSPIQIHKAVITDLDEYKFSYKLDIGFTFRGENYESVFLDHKEALENAVGMEDYRIKVTRKALANLEESYKKHKNELK